MLFLESISASIVAWVFTAVLMEGGMIFYPYSQWLERLKNRGMEWLAKPLGDCGTCFSGQVGFWWYLLTYCTEWTITGQLSFTAQTIFFYLIIAKWTQENELI